MTGNPNGADGQDAAEAFDETNTTRNGERSAVPDMAPDVLDVTVAEGDGLEGDLGGMDRPEDFDPDEVDEVELEFMLESDDGVDAPHAGRRDDADRVAEGDTQPQDYEPDRLSDDEIARLGHRGRRRPSLGRRGREQRLDEALEETFPASDPVSISPGAD